MTITADSPESLSQEELIDLIFEMCHRAIIHHVFWYNEVNHQMGSEVARNALENVFRKSFAIHMKRLSKILGFELKNGFPAAMADMSRDSLLSLMEGVGVNWLANDGVWFQEIEFSKGMNDAKRCNDSCWALFSPYEANSIKKLLRMGDRPGLTGLKKALRFRLYTLINKISFIRETPDSFVFEINECRVQSARQRKGLDDYPCKSGGLVEYTYFARAIDDRIETECVGCPPDEHPEEWVCAWKFSLSS